MIRVPEEVLQWAIGYVEESMNALYSSHSTKHGDIPEADARDEFEAGQEWLRKAKAVIGGLKEMPPRRADTGDNFYNRLRRIEGEKQRGIEKHSCLVSRQDLCVLLHQFERLENESRREHELRQRVAELEASLTDIINRRAAVENALIRAAAGKDDLPDEERCAELAKKLGVPSEYNVSSISCPNRRHTSSLETGCCVTTMPQVTRQRRGLKCLV